jgi:NADH-quinone oxidoreductase subunit A
MEFKELIVWTCLLLLAVGVPAGLMLVGWILAPHRQTSPRKGDPYECGLTETVGTAGQRFSVKYYLVAMLFLVFDLEVAFLYPWAAVYGSLGWSVFWFLLIFLFLLEAGYLYLYRKGALDWA